MQTYIALLRGINVAGYNSIKMTDLRLLLANIGLKNIVTYIQSGNIVFSSDEKNAHILEQLILNKIEEKYGYQIKVIVITPSYLNQICVELPFGNIKDLDFKKLGVVFFKELPSENNIEKVIALKKNEELLAFKNKVAYLYCPNGFASTKLSNHILETKLNVSATTRNWRTINKLLELSN